MLNLTIEQKDELLSRLIFAGMNMRYWEKQIHSEHDYDTIAQIKKWEERFDKLLEVAGVEDYTTLKEIFDNIKQTA